jgi:hypothetical protein
MVRSLASVILKKIWAKLIVLKQRQTKQEENTRLQKEDYQDRKLSAMTLLATKQIQLQVDKSLEPKLEVLLAQKVRTTALKTKPFRKEQTFNVKFNTQSSNTREHFEKKETRQREHSDESESILAKFCQKKT